MEHLTAFLTRMPKVELHVHLESTMPGEMLARFAARQGRELPRPAERLYDCSAEDLSDFLAFLDNICSFVGTPEELAEAAEHAALESGREHILYRPLGLTGLRRGAARTADSPCLSPAPRRGRRPWPWWRI